MSPWGEDTAVDGDEVYYIFVLEETALSAPSAPSKKDGDHSHASSSDPSTTRCKYSIDGAFNSKIVDDSCVVIETVNGKDDNSLHPHRNHSA
ncbi:hypothetical protein NDU88_005039 [Pleurodeles waltl]|uniref:Uncharacterized protein n=1 Tax=Pleurodeles waltl TaxID=8319 RepID=A0AAV7TB38_PLEWA|nr:hypothetical protein NDU88_005039 [Pleurodeles waltl]